MRTGRTGAAAKAGHDLVIEVASWQATLLLGEAAEATTVELTADTSSLRVIEGTGGMQALGDDDKRNIEQTIDAEVLKHEEIAFRSTAAAAGNGGRVRIEGELTILGRTEPVGFDLEIGDDGSLAATAVVAQTDWGLKPYSALFGALKVADEVEVVLEGHL